MSATFLAALGLFATIFGALVYVLPVSLDASDSHHFSQTRFWGHKGGGANEFPQNSPQAVANAFAKGLDGVELDTYFDRALDKIVVSHDLPYIKQGGEIITLDTFPIPANGRLWLDLKNLKNLSDSDMKRVAQIFAELDLTDRTLVESTAMLPLIRLNAHGVQTIFWMYADDTRSPIYYIAVKVLTWVFGINGVSVSIGNLEYVQPHFASSSIFTFTENSPKRLCELSNQSAVAVVLTDLPAQRLSSKICE